MKRYFFISKLLSFSRPSGELRWYNSFFFLLFQLSAFLLPRTHLSIDVILQILFPFYLEAYNFDSPASRCTIFFGPLLHPPSSFSAPLPSVRITFYALVLELLLPIVKVLLEKFSMEPFAFKPEFPRGEFAFKTITLLLRAFSGVEALSMERLTFQPSVKADG